MIFTELTFFLKGRDKEKTFYAEGSKGDLPFRIEYKTSYLQKDYFKVSKRINEGNLKQARVLGLNTKALFSVPSNASHVKVSLPMGEIKIFKIRRKDFKEKLIDTISEHPEDEMYYTSPFLTRPAFKTLRKWFVSIFSLYLFLKYGSQKDNVLLPIPSPHRIGHGLTNFDVATHEIGLGFFGKRPKEIIAFYGNSSPVFNQASIQYTKPFYLSIFERGFAPFKNTKVRFIFASPFYYSALCRLFRKTKGRIYPMRTYGHRDIFGCIKKSRPSFILPVDILDYGTRFCRENNIDLKRPTILFANREPGGIVTNDQSAEIKRYGFRNTTINNLIPTTEYLAKEYNVVRIGKSLNKLNLKVGSFYDLSTIPESADKTMLDFFFFSLCSFFIGSTSGIFAIGQIMRKPIVWTNTVPIGHYSCWSDWDISIHKLLKDKKSGKLVSFKDTLQLVEGWGQHAEEFSGHFDFIENTDDEILEATKEMEKQLKNRHPNKQSYLNKKLISQYPKHAEIYLKHRGTVSEYFLNKHKKLI
jgi:putative glycosyltransferase (TIGR04372 family)